MTSILFKYVLTAILTVHLTKHIVLAEQNQLKKSPNRFLYHLFRKYGSHGTISFEVILIFSELIKFRNFSVIFNFGNEQASQH